MGLEPTTHVHVLLLMLVDIAAIYIYFPQILLHYDDIYNVYCTIQLAIVYPHVNECVLWSVIDGEGAFEQSWPHVMCRRRS